MGITWTMPAKWSDNWPDQTSWEKYDQEFGFDRGRKERVMIATDEELESAGIDMEFRDYCAHEYLKYRACRRDHFPFMWRCVNAKHHWAHCEYEDYLLRMKEWERERRLVARNRRIAQQAIALEE